MRKVLVTGGCGFLGSHVCEFYAKKGMEVIAYDNLTKHELQRTGFAVDAARYHNNTYLQRIGVDIVKADVRDFDVLYEQSQGVDYIIHTAAQPAMTISWEDPVLDFSTNVTGTFNVLEVARRREIPVACCATIHVYGNTINESLKEGADRYVREPAEINEEHPTLGGVLTPLHASKASGDIYVKTYIDTYGVQAASFRLTGIYGTRQFGGEDHGWVANFAIRSVLGWQLTIFGTGKQVRDILYVHDVCTAFDAFYTHRQPGIYNIGGGAATAVSLLQCIDVLRELNGEAPEVRFEPDRHADLRYFICDITKAGEKLGWSPAVMPKDGIAQLLQWIKDHKHMFVQK